MSVVARCRTSLVRSVAVASLGTLVALVSLAPPAGAGGGIPECDGVEATIYDFEGDAGRLVGTAGPDVIVGSLGKDTIEAKGGADLICGSGASDDILGGTETDRIYGDAGNDTHRDRRGPG